jgi:hypothetical protein
LDASRIGTKKDPIMVPSAVSITPSVCCNFLITILGP